MIYVFDLDFTLFDTKKYLADLRHAMGISRHVFDATRKKYFYIDNFIHKYNGYRHIDLLRKSGYLDNVKKARRGAAALFKTPDRYVFPEAERLLKKLRGKKHRLILVTFGDRVWQKAKVRHLAIRQYFDRIIYTGREKSQALVFLKKAKDKVIVVNDNARENRAIAGRLGDRAKIYLVKSMHSRNIPHDMKEYELNELLKIL